MRETETERDKERERERKRERNGGDSEVVVTKISPSTWPEPSDLVPTSYWI